LRSHYDAIESDLLATDVVENMATFFKPDYRCLFNQIGFNWQGKDPNTCQVSGSLLSQKTLGKTIGWRSRKEEISPKNLQEIAWQ